MILWNVIAVGITAYLLGSVNLSIILSHLLLKKDIRQVGSGNAGGTNVSRVMGWKAGLVVVLFDAAKGVLASLLGLYFAGDPGLFLAGICVVLGHVAPVYYHFRGGKGVATGAAVYAVMDWRGFLIILAVFLLTVLLTRYVSLGSMLGAASFCLAEIFLPGVSPWCLVAAFLISGLVIGMHWENIKRLRLHTERKLSFGKSK